MAVIALAVAVSWLTGRERRLPYARPAPAVLLLTCCVLLVVEVFTNNGVKEVVFDGWLDNVADAIDGTSDRDERIAKESQRSGRGALLST